MQTTLISQWPPLAWLANCRHDGIEVLHGPGAEVADDWFCEAAWAGDFSAGNFDQVEIVSGSGGRQRKGKVVFVSSASTVDRLHSWQSNGTAVVSNSLPCLLQFINGTLRPSYQWYNRDLHTITEGLHRYKRFIETSAGPVQFTYYHNLAWDGKDLRVEEKPNLAPEFTNYEQYIEYLESHLCASE